jgi:hypothetical protein
MTLLEMLAKGPGKAAGGIKGIWEPLFWLMGALFAVSVGLVLFFWSRGVVKDTLDMEIAKVALQGGIVAVIGTLLALLVSRREDRVKAAQKALDESREDRRYREERLKATLTRIRSSYNNSKRARRNMRALARDCSKKPAVLDLAHYDKYMAELNEAQLELEAIVSDVESDKETYASAYALLGTLTKMEKYLCAIVSEYEKERSQVGRKAVRIPLGKLTALSEFLDHAEEGSPFKTQFSHGHHAAQEAILKDLHALTSKP